jgi:hypothetical protein
MTKFTQLNLNAKSEQKNTRCAAEIPVRQPSSIARTKTAMLGGLLAVGVISGAALLALNGCSKKEPVKSEVTPASPPAMSNSSAVSTSSMPAVSETQQPKPTKKAKKSATVTYVNRTYGLSLQYPRKYALKTGEDAQLELNGSPMPMDFVQPGGINVAAIEMPPALYPGTDLNAAFLTVNVNRNMTESECGQFAVQQLTATEVKPVSDEKPVPTSAQVSPEKVKIAGKEFSQMEKSEGNGMKQSEAKYYHAFENGACYEFALGLGTGINGAEKEIKPVDRDAVFGKLEKILATVKIKGPVVAKPVVAKEGTKEEGADCSDESFSVQSSSVEPVQPTNVGTSSAQPDDVAPQRFEPTPVHPEE